LRAAGFVPAVPGRLARRRGVAQERRAPKDLRYAHVLESSALVARFSGTARAEPPLAGADAHSASAGCTRGYLAAECPQRTSCRRLPGLFAVFWPVSPGAMGPWLT
jgi:hypothetical protein